MDVSDLSSIVFCACSSPFWPVGLALNLSISTMVSSICLSISSASTWLNVGIFPTFSPFVSADLIDTSASMIPGSYTLRVNFRPERTIEYFTLSISI